MTARGRGPGALAHVAIAVVVLAACSGGSDRPDLAASRRDPSAAIDLTVVVDTDRELGPISPLIRGMSGVDAQYMRDAGVTVNSWGGNPSSRFNYEIGHAWNAGADWEFRNTNYGNTGDSAVSFVREANGVGAAVRLAVPTLGWIARNDDDTVCSFPTSDGGCTGGQDANCEDGGAVADPSLANVESTPTMVQEWVDRIVNDEHLDVAFIAMDNEPELWGHTHYDVHPTCTTFEEVLEKYLTYATAVHDVAPDAELLGPVTCCWFDYWDTAPGPADGSDVDYVTWFLQELREHEEQTGVRLLDVLDVHYYPQSNVYNDDVESDTAARRLRSTQSLWDPEYNDESWLGDEIRFIPRLQETIDAVYPGTKLAITEWNFGADGTMNGALAIADVLGIYGREGVYMASYWRNPDALTPGYFAFKMYGNYDGAGSSFSGTAVAADSPDPAPVASYAAVDPADGHLRVMLINKDPEQTLNVRVDVSDWAGTAGTVYRYSEADLASIATETLAVEGAGVNIVLPAYSITLLDLAPAG